MTAATTAAPSPAMASACPPPRREAPLSPVLEGADDELVDEVSLDDEVVAKVVLGEEFVAEASSDDALVAEALLDDASVAVALLDAALVFEAFFVDDDDESSVVVAALRPWMVPPTTVTSPAIWVFCGPLPPLTRPPPLRSSM